MQVLMQSEILDWFAGNVGLAIVMLTMVFIILLALYIKRYVRIFSPEIHILHYRRGRLIGEYKNGGMVILMPLFDVLKGKMGQFEEIPESLDSFNEWWARRKDTNDS